MIISQAEINRVLETLFKSNTHDINGLTSMLNKFLQVQRDHIVSYMNFQCFRGQNNMIAFIHNSIDNNGESEAEVRKIVYGFVGDYINVFKNNLGDYLAGIFQKFYSFFKKQTSFRPKAEALIPIKEILLNFTSNDLNGVLNPVEFHKSLTNTLKIQTKMQATVRGELWYIVGILQNKFASSISYTQKKDVEIICLSQLKKLVNQNKNVSTISSILKSFAFSLNQNYLDDNVLEQLFNYTKAIMIPLKDTFGASISALELISAQSTLFHPFIMKHAGYLFKTLTGLMGHQNKEYKFTVLDTLAVIVKQIVAGISGNIEDPKMLDLFNFIGTTMWGMLEQQTRYDPTKPQQKNRYSGSAISIVKILGTLSTLIKSINGKNDLKRFFSKLLNICNRKVIKAFEQTEETSGATKRIHVIKTILYNQKQLVSFLNSFARILEQLQQIEYKEALSLEQLFLVGVRQYPFFLQKYIPQLIESMVLFLMSLFQKRHIFTSWCKKIILISLMQSLDAKRFNINNDNDYYLMIRKSSRMWRSILTHNLGSRIAIKQFSKILFESLEHLFLNLDISYKTSIELQIESEDIKQREQEIELVNVFFMSDQNIQMSNIADYQYVSSLALVYNEIMLNIDSGLYEDRVYGFYEQIIYRIKIFPKSIPLMKVIRSLNAYIIKSNWFNQNQESGNTKKIKQLESILRNFFKFVCDNIFKYQQNYFYEALKMLLSMPIKIFLSQECDILKNNLPGIITKSLELGQQIISLAHETLECLNKLFREAKEQSVSYLSSCLPFLQKYINFNKNTVEGEDVVEEKQQVRSYLFLYQCQINRKQISANVMKFLGSIGGISHMMVENSTKDYISWDYYCKIDLTVIMGGDTIDINLTKMLSRTCWLMLHGTEVQKIVSSQFMHAIMVYVIGRAAPVGQNHIIIQTKENLSNFFDRVLPTLLSVSSNPSHPSQQLIHTLVIQTIHFLANTQDPNSPDIQTLLKHLITLYTGAQDLSFLASKCLSQLVKWHIKQSLSQNTSYPLVKTVIRNIWSLVSNKKARNGLIQFLIKFLKAIHRQNKLMSIYAIQLCSLIISIGRTEKQIEPMLEYLIKKYILAIGPHIKPLIFEQGSRKFKKLSTLQKLLLWIYNSSLFSLYRQQRLISYTLWEAILTKYGHIFNANMKEHDSSHNIQIFLSDQCNRELKYLFGQNKRILIDEDEPKLDKLLPKISAYGQMWIKIVKNKIFQVSKLMKFKDFQEVYLESFCSFMQYICKKFINLDQNLRIVKYDVQKSIVDCILIFIELLLCLEKEDSGINLQIIEFMAKKIPFFDRLSTSKNKTFVQILFKFIYRPNSIIPNFNYDLIYQCSQNTLSYEIEKQSESARKQLQQNYYFRTICKFLQSILSNNLLPSMLSFLKSQFKIDNVDDLVPYIVQEKSFYDREIKCVLNSLSVFANNLQKDNKIFISLLKVTLKFIVDQFEEVNEKNQIMMEPNERQNLSNEKKNLLIWYILQHAENYTVIRDFLVAVIQKDTMIYQKHEKVIIKSIIANWFGVGQKLMALAKNNNQFLKLVFLLCKMLPEQKKENLYELIQKYLIGIGTRKSDNIMIHLGMVPAQQQNKNNTKGSAISEMLKISFFLFEEGFNFGHMNENFQIYVYNLACEGLNTIYSSDIHEQSMNLTGLLIRQQNKMEENKEYKIFIQKMRIALSNLTKFYVPFKISKLPTTQSRNKCGTFLKVFKSMVILSNNVRYLQFIFALLKDSELEIFYAEMLEEIIDECLFCCYEKNDNFRQADDLRWMINFYWHHNIDTDCWMNIRVVLVDQILRKAIRMTKQEVLINIFQEETQKLINKSIKAPITLAFGSVKQLVLHLQLKRAAFQILEELYSNLPRKQKNTEEIHKKQIHKEIIRYCTELLKPKSLEVLKQNQQAQQMLREHDRKTAQEEAQKLVVLKTEKLQGKKPKSIEYLRRYFCGVYNCLLVVFISTQSNKALFQTYLFESKGLLWKKIIDQEQQDFNFQILTNFSEMKPIAKINKKLNKKIKQKYWQNSLYAIQQEYVPTSLVENLPEISQEPQNKGNLKSSISQSLQNEKVLELDIVNRHPCMVNLLRILDFMHQKFYDGTLPGWMKPIHEELSSDYCPLAIRILLTKLIINRPLIFTQDIWAQILLKYLLLKQNGGKFIHYYFRDAIKQYLTFVQNGFKYQNMADLSNILMKVIRALPHEDIRIYSDNIDIMESLLKIQGIYAHKNTIVSMIKANQKSKSDVHLKFQWRMCVTMALKLCLLYEIPVFDTNEPIPKNKEKVSKFKFYFQMRKEGLLNLIFQMAGQSVKKYRIAVSGFLGQLLRFVTESEVQKLEQEELFKATAKFLSNMNMQQSNRNAKQKFSLCILNVSSRFPQILDDPRLYNQAESGLSLYCKEQRFQILQAFQNYCQYLIKRVVIGYIPHIFVTIRSIINKLLSDILQVQSTLINLMYDCCKHEVLLNKQVIQTFYYVYDELQRVFGTTVHSQDALTFYKILISLKDFTSDPDLPKTNEIRSLNQKVSQSLLKGLKSPHEKVKQLLIDQFQRQSKDYGDSAERMIDILVRLYSPQNQDLWLINVVPLIYSLIKKSSDYTRLRFEKPLGEITAFYDWDFRKNMKIHNSSQPYTPAFTLATGANNLYRRPDGTIQPSFNPTIGGDKLKGMIKASQNFYMSQQEQVFTLLASQSDYQPSYEASLSSEVQPSLSGQTTESQQNRLKQIFINARKKRNKNMEDFKLNNLKNYNSSIKVIDNKIRFNKNFDKSLNSLRSNNSGNNQKIKSNAGNRGVLIRKYKVGELPDIQITTKDIVDPMLYLANCDHQFASELFIIIFMKICLHSRKEKKEKFKQTICWLLKSSKKYQYNFISTLEKSLICLCHNQKQKIEFSMKQIALRSNTLDYAIVFTEENQIQMIKQADFQDDRTWQQKVNDIWGDLIDMYQQINEEDLIYGVLIRLAEGDQRKLLLQALNLKKVGNVKKSEQFLNAALEESNSKRIKQFINKQKIDCSTILGAWEPVKAEMTRKNQQGSLSITEQKILTIALQNTQFEEKSQFLRKNNFHDTKCEYEKAILHILFEKDYDMAFHHLQKSIEYFSTEWKKISSFAFNSKHCLLEEVQKKFQLQQFLEVYKKQELKDGQHMQLFAKWSNRQPNSIYDSNLTFLQILESRKMFSQLLSNKFKIEEKILTRSTIDWLIQMSNGMVQKGVLGGAETLIKRALLCKRKQKQFFIWDFYESVAHLKLKQLQVQKTKIFKQYEIVANLVERQMSSNQTQIVELEKLKFISLKNNLFEGYLSSCLTSDNINTADFVNKIEIIFKNYNELRRNIKQNIFQGSTQKQLQEYKRDMFFKFTMFLQKMLSFVNQKSNFATLKESMIQKNYNSQRIAHLFVEMLFTSIEISDFTNHFGNFERNMVFSLIMKLIKIVQIHPLQVGQYFSEAINNKRIPIWIFLYFIPQMIKFINNSNLVAYFEDLFRIISNIYPEALVYHFNCSYEQEKDCLTPFCQEMFRILRQKMDINFKFIDSLVLLQYPEIRLRESIGKFLNISYERENALNQIKNLIKPNQYLGKYNKKFVQDWEPKINKVINKINSNDSSAINDLKTILSYIDPSRKQNLKTVAARMKEFVKVSDGSIFFEQYNSNDWNRIEIPGTSYRTFQEPKPWKKTFIQSFDHSLLTLQSKQRPRRITIYGSNEKKYMLLIKGGQDVRLDQRIQQLFEIMNRILKSNSQCSKKQLQIRRFQVTPIKKMMGIFEWVDQSQTLKQFLETQFKIIKQSDKVNFREGNGAFQLRMEFLNKLSPQNSGNKDPNHQHKAILNAKRPEVIKSFIECEKQIPYGLLRRALERLSKNYDSFLHIKNSFIGNYALICCVTYILGIGDRHLQNFLIHMGSASVVPIDFGYSFGASLQLGVPQLIPFRLTKCFEQLMDPIGFQGIFKKSMIASFQVFAQNIALISDYCEVFVDDPLLEWIWTHKKNTSSSMNKNQQFENSQDPPQKALFTEKIKSVRKKLQGENPRMLYETMLKNSRHRHEVYAKSLTEAIWGYSKMREKNLSISDVVDELISLSTDKNVLGRTYIGWNPYV